MGFYRVFYFEYVAFIGHIELVVHRCLWTAFNVDFNNNISFKMEYFFKIISNKSYLIYLFGSGFLIFVNWAVWIYAVASERIIDASFGYFIMPILSVLLGYIFLKKH